MLTEMETRRLELELADAYTANAKLGLAMAKELAHVDREGL
jgi:hypothetical protein